MKRDGWTTVVILTLLVFFATPKGFAAETAASLKAESEAAEAYKAGQAAYWTGNYAEAISHFSRVSAIDPNYKAKNVKAYQSLAEYRLRGKKKDGKIAVYQEPRREEIPKKDVLINDNQEWLHLVGETEAVLLDAATYLQKVQASGEVPTEKLIDSNYYLKQARLAFERQEYLDAIRFSYLVKEKTEAAFEACSPPETKILGKLGETPVTFNVTDLDLKEALKQIYDLTGVNIVLSSGISGRVTMNVKDVPLRQVLDLIVDTNGLKYVEKENVVMIMTPEEYEKTAAGLAARNKKVYPLHFAEAKAVAKVVRESLGIEGVTADVRSNAIIADAASAKQAEEIDTLVRELDVPTNQVLIEAQLLEVTYSKNKALGINFLIQSRMIDSVRLSGPQWGSVPSTLPAESEGVYFALTHKDFSALFNALAKEGETRLIQSPRIMTVSGTPAVIVTAEQIPYSQFQTTNVNIGGGIVQPQFTRTVGTVEVGTTFQVIPLIQNNRTVALTVSLTVGRVKEMVRLPLAISGGSAIYDEYPLIESRSTTQNVVLWDGESLVVGGIMATEDLRDEVRVPVLGKIPVLGNLFRRSHTTQRETELILFLTPRIVLNYEEGRTLTREYQALPAGKELKKGIIEQPWF